MSDNGKKTTRDQKEDTQSIKGRLNLLRVEKDLPLNTTEPTKRPSITCPPSSSTVAHDDPEYDNSNRTLRSQIKRYGIY